MAEDLEPKNLLIREDFPTDEEIDVPAPDYPRKRRPNRPADIFGCAFFLTVPVTLLVGFLYGEGNTPWWFNGNTIGLVTGGSAALWILMRLWDHMMDIRDF